MEDVKVKVLVGGRMPERKSKGAACYDCYARKPARIKPFQTEVVPLGFCIELPDDLMMEIRPRSGMTSQGYVEHLGTIDSDYRGEVSAIITNMSWDVYNIKKDDRVCQMFFQKVLDVGFFAVESLGETERGDGGFGSTGK